MSRYSCSWARLTDRSPSVKSYLREIGSRVRGQPGHNHQHSAISTQPNSSNCNKNNLDGCTASNTAAPAHLMFQPSGPNLRLSCTTAWNRHRPNNRRLQARGLLLVARYASENLPAKRAQSQSVSRPCYSPDRGWLALPQQQGVICHSRQAPTWLIEPAAPVVLPYQVGL